ncbi:hypothetical protein BGX27_009996, partial [Mortierella sp. AM989]
MTTYCHIEPVFIQQLFQACSRYSTFHLDNQLGEPVDREQIEQQIVIAKDLLERMQDTKIRD